MPAITVGRSVWISSICSAVGVLFPDPQVTTPAPSCCAARA